MTTASSLTKCAFDFLADVEGYDIRDAAGLDSHSYRVLLVGMMSEILTEEGIYSNQALVTSLTVLNYVGLASANMRRVIKTWEIVKTKVTLDRPTIQAIDKFLRTRLTNSALDRRAKAGSHFPASQLASVAPTLGLRVHLASLVKKASRESGNNTVSVLALAFELLSMRSSVQINWTTDLQEVANLLQSAFWLLIVNKPGAAAGSLGKLDATIVLDYLHTSSKDEYPLVGVNTSVGEISPVGWDSLISVIVEFVKKEGAMTDETSWSARLSAKNILRNMGTMWLHYEGDENLVSLPQLLEYMLITTPDNEGYTSSVSDELGSMKSIMTYYLLSNTSVKIACDNNVMIPEGLEILVPVTTGRTLSLDKIEGLTVSQLSEAEGGTFEVYYENDLADPDTIAEHLKKATRSGVKPFTKKGGMNWDEIQVEDDDAKETPLGRTTEHKKASGVGKGNALVGRGTQQPTYTPAEQYSKQQGTTWEAESTRHRRTYHLSREVWGGGETAGQVGLELTQQLLHELNTACERGGREEDRQQQHHLQTTIREILTHIHQAIEAHEVVVAAQWLEPEGGDSAQTPTQHPQEAAAAGARDTHLADVIGLAKGGTESHNNRPSHRPNSTGVTTAREILAKLVPFLETQTDGGGEGGGATRRSAQEEEETEEGNQGAMLRNKRQDQGGGDYIDDTAGYTKGMMWTQEEDAHMKGQAVTNCPCALVGPCPDPVHLSGFGQRVTFTSLKLVEYVSDWPSLQPLSGFAVANSPELQMSAFAWEHALWLLEALPGEALLPDAVAYASATAACGRSLRWALAVTLLATSLDRRMASQAGMGAAIAAAAGRREWQVALSLLDQLKMQEMQPDVKSYTQALSAFEGSSCWQKALSLLFTADELGMTNDICYTAAMRACSDEWQWSLALLSRLPNPDRRAFNVALNSCAKASKRQVALTLLRRIPAPDAVSYNSALTACVGADGWMEALVLLAELADDADTISFNVVLAACEAAGAWLASLQLLECLGSNCNRGLAFFLARPLGGYVAININHRVALPAGMLVPEVGDGFTCGLADVILSPGVVLSEVAVSCTIRAAGGVHRWQVAIKLLEQMEDLTVESNEFGFSSAIDACSKASQWLQAMGIFMSMPVASIQCNEVCLNAALAGCQRARRWRQALALWAWAEERELVLDRALLLGAAALAEPQPGVRGEVLGALACLCEDEGHPAGRQLFQDLARAAHASGLGGLGQALATAAGYPSLNPLGVAAQLRGALGGGAITGRRPYQKEVALLRRVVDLAQPGDAASVVQQMENFGAELGSAGGWAKFAAGSKAKILLLGSAGAAPSPKHVLDIGAYGGGSALHLAQALPGVHVTAIELDPVMVALARCLLGFAGVGDRVHVLPGHTRLRLPALEGRRFAAIFVDVWGAQYAEVLALIHRHGLLLPGSVLIADNVLRTGAAEFAGRVAGRGFRTLVMPVQEVSKPDEEDWMTVSVLRHTDWEPRVPDELQELQARSERLRDATANEGVAPEEHRDFSEQARGIFRKAGIVPVGDRGAV
ncbi:Comt [Symbiodinium natans]|uniref:Comt protein n=1 Tax=Symbiodinium natans TaxID=878477 RepID=A0A812R054_9DINO|nr:Comt [Symbiodinium natans]